jgi:hypothetical protein
VKRTHVESSAIRSVGYDAQQRILEVRYVNGALYRYLKVPPEVMEYLEKAPSKGGFVNTIVKPHFKMEKIAA